MTSIIVDRLDGLSSSVAIKGPCRVVTTANITLSGTQTIDGVLVAVGDRVLVKNQTTASENGIYLVDTGSWRRTKDFSRSNDIVVGTQIFVTSGTLYSQSGWLVSTFTSVGDAAIVFTQNVLVNGAALAALEASAQAASDAAELAQAEAEAAQASAELAASNIIPIGVIFGYSTTTADADPGAGLFRFNNATIASVTAAYIDNADNAANSVTAWLDTFDDSSNTVKGSLMIRGVTTPAAWAAFDVTGSVVDGTGYRKLTLTHKGSGGTWTNSDVFAMDFSRAGDAGAGTGDVVGPASATTARVASFNGTTGKLIQDSGLLVTDIVTLTGSQTLTNKTLTGPIFNTSPVDMQVGQLKFPATANASSNANTLDDYEEGTFTPAFSATGSTFSYLSQTGEYVKIGKLVFIYADVRINTSGNTLTGNALTITGLPFTVGSNSYRNSTVTWVNSTSSFVNMNFDFPAGTTTAQAKGITAAGVTNNVGQNANTALHATNGSILIISTCYIASA